MAPTEDLATVPTTQGRFLCMPPEIRNLIYELVFNDTPEKADLLEAAAPSKALLTTCHQIHNETRQVYRAAYRAYWSRTAFTITLRQDHKYCSAARNALYEKLARLKEQDVAHVKNLVIQSRIAYTLTDGVWFRFRHSHAGGLVGFVVVPRTDKDEADTAKLPHARDTDDFMVTGVFDGGNGEARFDGVKAQTQQKELSKAKLTMFIGWMTFDPRFNEVR